MLRVAVLAIAVVFSANLAACSSLGKQPASQPSQHGGGGGSGVPRYAEPRRVTPGEYVPPWAGEEGHARGIAAAQAEERNPPFWGSVNGFRLYDPQDDDSYRKYCAKGSMTEFKEITSIAYGYLPAGMFADGPQSAGYCGDGSLAQIWQSFGGAYIVLEIAFMPGEWAFPAVAARGRISQGPINGLPSVQIQPETREGFGTSMVAVGVPSGLFLVHGEGLPFGELTMIAEGLRCASC